MAPRENRTRHHAKVKHVVQNKFVEAGRRVIHAVRSLKVRDRTCATEFEVRPDPEVIPLYGQLITDPVAIQDLEAGLKDGSIHNAETLASRFMRMVRNAKSFNRPGSTIYKDANRLLEVFQKAMREELNFFVDDDDDVDEEEAWSRDLKERTQLAAYERDQYLEVQAQIAKKKCEVSKTARQLAAETELDAFEDSSLQIQWCRNPANLKKEINGHELRKGLASLRLTVDRRDSPHSRSACLICCQNDAAVEAEVANHHLGHVVVTPKYHIITPVNQKPSTPRPTLPKPELADIEPLAMKRTRKRAPETPVLAPPSKSAKVRTVVAKHDHQLRSRRRTVA